MSYNVHDARRLFHLRRLFSRIEIPAVVPKSLSCSRPLRPISEVSEFELKRLGYLFSCNGNVTLQAGGKQLAMSIDSVHQWIPLEFYIAFGGQSATRPGRGGARPSYSWRIGGIPAVKLARTLAPYAGRKTELLEAFGSLDNSVRRNQHLIQALQDNLAKLKHASRQNFFKHPEVQSWSEFAHLLDCRGSIGFVPVSGAIRILISHSNRDLLLSVSVFLRTTKIEAPSFPKVHSLRCFRSEYPFFAWDMQGRSRAVSIIENALENGLFVLKERAEEVVALLERGDESRLSTRPRCNHQRNKALSPIELELSRLLGFLRKMKAKKVQQGRDTRALHLAMQMAWKEREASKRRTEITRIRGEVRDKLKL